MAQSKIQIRFPQETLDEDVARVAAALWGVVVAAGHPRAEVRIVGPADGTLNGAFDDLFRDYPWSTA